MICCKLLIQVVFQNRELAVQSANYQFRGIETFNTEEKHKRNERDPLKSS